MNVEGKFVNEIPENRFKQHTKRLTTKTKQSSSQGCEDVSKLGNL